MNKRGQIEVAILLVIIVLGGITYGGYTIATSDKYIGDLNTHLVYDTTKCKLSINNAIKFNSLEQAHNSGFKNAPNCI